MSKSDKIFCIVMLCIIITLFISHITILNNSNKETKNISTNDEVAVTSVNEIPTTTNEIPTTTEVLTKSTETKVEIEQPKAEPIETETIDTYISVEPPITNSQFYLDDYERWVVECMVMGEAGGESYEGQVLVAQCILNACELDGLNPSEVMVEFQYSGWNDYPSESVKKAVSAVFDEGYKITDEPILYFYSPSLCDSEWHETQKFVISEGSHRFFARW